MFTSDQIGGLIRTVALAALTYAAGKGWLGADAVSDVAGAIAVIGVAIWSAWTNRPAKIIK